eukprot:3709896-Prymnesium_polylepis.1
MMARTVHMNGTSAGDGWARQVKASADKPLTSKPDRASESTSSHEEGNSKTYGEGGMQDTAAQSRRRQRTGRSDAGWGRGPPAYHKVCQRARGPLLGVAAGATPLACGSIPKPALEGPVALCGCARILRLANTHVGRVGALAQRHRDGDGM